MNCKKQVVGVHKITEYNGSTVISLDTLEKGRKADLSRIDFSRDLRHAFPLILKEETDLEDEYTLDLRVHLIQLVRRGKYDRALLDAYDDQKELFNEAFAAYLAEKITSDLSVSEPSSNRSSDRSEHPLDHYFKIIGKDEEYEYNRKTIVEFELKKIEAGQGIQDALHTFLLQVPANEWMDYAQRGTVVGGKFLTKFSTEYPRQDGLIVREFENQHAGFDGYGAVRILEEVEPFSTFKENNEE